MYYNHKQAECKLTFVLLIFLFQNIFCSNPSVKEGKDKFGRTVKKTTYTNNNFKLQEETSYFGNTELPLVKVYKRIIDGSLIPWWTEVYSYGDNRLIEIKFFIIINDKRTQSGNIGYQYDEGKLKKVEYYSLVDREKQILKTHGFDLYYYSRGSVVKRRIIEYEYNPETNNNIQISQYVFFYRKDSIVSMETKMLDNTSKMMITKNETNLNIITEMIGNIEKSLKDRCKGISMLSR